jgi:S-adenosylhomocysteine hydrolase
MSTTTNSQIDFNLKNKVADMSLAEWGRKEIRLAEARCLVLCLSVLNTVLLNRLKGAVLQDVFT